MATWIINPSGGGDFTSINTAIGDGSVNNGDTLQLANGTYNEDVVITKRVKLQGSGLGTIIKAPTNYGIKTMVPGTNTEWIEIHDLVIEDCPVDGFWTAAHSFYYIKLQNVISRNNTRYGAVIGNNESDASHDIQVLNCQFLNNGSFGLRTNSQVLDVPCNYLIDGCTFDSNVPSGLSCQLYISNRTINGLTISNCKFYNDGVSDPANSWTAIYFEGGLQGVTIDRCTFNNCVYRCIQNWTYSGETTDLTISNCLFENMGDGSEDGISAIAFFSSASHTLHGVVIEDCQFMNFDAPDISRGIRIYTTTGWSEISDIRVTNCTFEGMTHGIDLQDYALGTVPNISDIDARRCYWDDFSGPSGGIADSSTGDIANGQGVLIGSIGETSIRFVPFLYDTPYYEPFENAIYRRLSQNKMVMPTGTPGSNSSQDYLEQAQYEGQMPIYVDGKVRIISGIAARKFGSGVIKSWDDRL